MLVILMENQLLDPHRICQGCPLADHSGQPRWRGGNLSCGHRVHKPIDNLPSQYECQMGFRIAHIE